MAALAAGVTVLINNAGINLRAPFFTSSSMEAARREMEANYFGTLDMRRTFAAILVRNVQSGGCAIVKILSILEGHIAEPGVLLRRKGPVAAADRGRACRPAITAARTLGPAPCLCGNVRTPERPPSNTNLADKSSYTRELD